MATMSFDELVTEDVNNVFLKGEFSQEAIYQTGSEIRKVTVQFFEEPLDKLGANLHHVWCNFVDLPRVIKNKDTLTLNNIKYGILDASPDEFGTGLNLYLQKV